MSGLVYSSRLLNSDTLLPICWQFKFKKRRLPYVSAERRRDGLLILLVSEGDFFGVFGEEEWGGSFGVLLLIGPSMSHN